MAISTSTRTGTGSSYAVPRYYVPTNYVENNNPDPEPPPKPTGPLGGPGGDFPPDTSGWDTDGYATPGFTASNFGQYAPSGWDQTKWASPTHQTPKYVWGRIYQSNPNTAEGRATMIQQLQQAYPGTTLVGNDKANIPGVGLIDLWTAADIGQYGISWNPVDEYRQDDPVGTGTDTTADPWASTMTAGQPSPYQPTDFSNITSRLAAGPAAYTPYAWSDLHNRITSSLDAPDAEAYTPTFDWPGLETPAMAPYTAPVPGPFTGGARSADQEAFANQVRQVLTQLMGRSQTPLASDPEIALPASAFRNAQQRSEERQKGELAERASYEGWSDSGAFDTEARGLSQARGQNEAAYEAGLWADAAERRLSEITQAVTLGSQFLTQQDQLQLEREMAELERGIEQARLAQQESQYGRTFGEEQRQFNVDQMTERALEEARLAQNESQFGRTFGENRRQFNVDQLSRLALEEAGLAQNESQFGRTFAENARQFGIDAAMRLEIEEQRLRVQQAEWPLKYAPQ